MKHKDGDKLKPSTSHSSNKGRRKLEFEKKTKQLPLSGKIIYLDVKDVRQAKILEEKLKQLGGTVEKFLIKDVNYVISSNAPTSGQKTDKGRRETADNPAYQSTPSPFNMGQSPSPGAVETKKETVTRGKAMLQIAKHKSSHTNVINTAEKMGIKIVGLNAAVKWIEKEMLKIKPGVPTSSRQVPKKKAGLKVQKLKTPYVKFEAVNCHYRPIMHQLERWPHVSVDTLSGTCPFDGRALGKPQNSERGDREEIPGGGHILSPGTPQAQRDELSGTPQPKSQSKTTRIEENSTCKLFGVPIVTAGEIKRERDRRKRESRRKGYCECCKEKYDDVDRHLRGEQHKSFVRNKKNFDALDHLINQGPNTVVFLQSILFKHCVQQAANRPGSKQACEDEVLLIENTSERTCDTHSPKLPPEQLKVERKMNRRHWGDRKPDMSRKLVVEVEKINLNHNHETSKRLETDSKNKLEDNNQGYSSPIRPRSGSFPRVERDSSQATAAVVIRRSGSRGIYGSPRRHHSTSRSEKTLVIRDSPIASLQPLKDFLKKHSTCRDSDGGSKPSSQEGLSVDVKKRKSSPNSPGRKKRQRNSNEIQVDVTVHSQDKHDMQQKVYYQKKTASSERTSQLVNQNDRNCPKHNEKVTDELKTTPEIQFDEVSDKVPCEIASPRKSLRISGLASHCSDKTISNDQTKTTSGVTDTLIKNVFCGDSSSCSKQMKTNNSTSITENQSKSVQENIHEGNCARSPRSKQRKPHDLKTRKSDNNLENPTTIITMEDTEIMEDITIMATRSRSSPRKLPKDNQEDETDATKAAAGSNIGAQCLKELETDVKSKSCAILKRRKWKEKIQSSPSKVKRKRLGKLKLDESLCSDVSIVSEASSPPKPIAPLKDETVNRNYPKASDSSSPTFKKCLRKEEINERGCKRLDSEMQTNISCSPVFKRKLRHGVRDSQEKSSGVLCEESVQVMNDAGLKAILEKTPKRGKSGKSSKSDSEEECNTETPKSGYSTTPRRPLRSRRSIQPELLDQTLCEDELDSTLQELSDCEETNMEDLSPVRTKKLRSNSRENEAGASVVTIRSKLSASPVRLNRKTLSRPEEECESPVKSRPRRGKSAEMQDLPKEATVMSDGRTLLNFAQSPSRTRPTRSRSVCHDEGRISEHSVERLTISNNASIKTPRKNNSEKAPMKSPHKIITNTRDIADKFTSTSTVKKMKEIKVISPKKTEQKGKRKWRRNSSGSKSSTKTVRLNRSWLLLSDRSMSKLMESEADQEPFLGFNKEESDSRLPSDLTYEEVSEVDMSEDSTREWVIDEEPELVEEEEDENIDKTLIEETSLVTRFFPSPDKASNSSWGDACDTFLQSACEKRLRGQTCSTPLLFDSRKNRSPIKVKRAKTTSSCHAKHNQTTGLEEVSVEVSSYSTPKKTRKISPKNLNKPSNVMSDGDIVFNFNYHSPRRRTGGDKRGSVSQDSGCTHAASPEAKLNGKNTTAFRILKKASDIKKTFKLSYGETQVKSPKTKQKPNFEPGRTVVIVSPKSKHK